VNEDNLSRGYVALYRSIIDNPFFTQLPGDYFKVFIFCLLRAAYKPSQYWNGHAMADLPIGSFCGNSLEMAAKTGISRMTVRRALQALEKSQMVVTKSTNKFTLYTVVNFEAYQNGNVATDQQTTNNRSVQRPTNDQQTTNKRPASLRREERKKEHPLPAEAVAEAVAVEAAPSRFDSEQFFEEKFWPIRWNTRDKQEALKSWKRLVKDKATAEDVLDNAVKQRDAIIDEALARNGRPPYMSTWLNKKRYTAEETAAMLPGFDGLSPIPTSPEQLSEKRRKALESYNADLEERGLPPVDEL
jgi:hypothetical protein